MDEETRNRISAEMSLAAEQMEEERIRAEKFAKRRANCTINVMTDFELVIEILEGYYDGCF